METHKKIQAQHGVAVVWDDQAGDTRKVQRADAVWDVADVWPDAQTDSTLGGEFVRFHPGRDIKWCKRSAMSQARALADCGVITFDSLTVGGVLSPDHLFKGDVGMNDFANLIDVCAGPRAKTVLDIAPDLFIAQELIKQSGEVVEEDQVELTARRLLPFTNYNTWMEQYRFDRIEKRGHGFSLPIDINSHAGIPTPKQSIVRKPVYRPLYHHYSGAVWSMLELEQLAEARANGAPDLDLIRIYTTEATDNIRRTENCLAYYGHPGLGIDGLLSTSEITHEGAAMQLGAGTTEDDRQIFMAAACKILNGTVRNEQADMVLVGTEVWCYLNTTIYKGLEADSTRTLLSVVMEGLAPLGVKRIEWAPEMEYRGAQSTRLQNEHGFSATLADAWSGGLDQENVIVFMSSNRAKGSVAMGKAVAARPRETMRDDVEARYIASSGGYDVRKPAAFCVITDVGPAA